MIELMALGPMLLVVAAPAEARAVLTGVGGDPALAGRAWERHEVRPGLALVVSGVGKVNAAGATLRGLRDHDRVVLSVGVAGALPRTDGAAALRIGDVVSATAAVYADEGLLDERQAVGVGGFVDLSAMGFALAGERSRAGAFEVDPRVQAAFRGVADAAGPVATVSTCSGTDALARAVSARTGGVAEAMEGAAVAHVLERLRMHEGTDVLFGELRIISNTTGTRERQEWDLKAALARLGEVLGRLAG
jgi:futalosine hydrolase